ncbi:uncharacterized protein ASPGLDRAFT_32116 [Aspergillus glaucus CBS 516.65]|uniref:Uncharacterized protein n=1 Tax=Aspergillus glaucus CBS 516.65 TaxID=1160497 RepID=A0A1L9VUM1_ASPGL|nr:hypothetical protein ASPGLDRAFT_32116 [Aspergillus glaucus CBS 516.65]OJJ87621.1 hypothetical protein ASPGLDRAFT_32116 [Aspergillus glaucus CBS 516.65]
MGHRHNRRHSRLRPNRNCNIDTFNSTPIDSDLFSRSLAPTWHYGSVNWTHDRPLRFEMEQCRLFGDEPGDNYGLWNTLAASTTSILETPRMIERKS